ncbi:hypothetical protein N5C91_26950, partial [Pseudomonas sp. GD03903]|nr:hypothetical protein [Pseudomonas sp. GD03903]
ATLNTRTQSFSVGRFCAASACARIPCFAPSGESLLANAPKGTKKSRPCHPAFRFAKSTLGSSEFQGPAAKGHPWPIAALATSMSLNP